MFQWRLSKAARWTTADEIEEVEEPTVKVVEESGGESETAQMDVLLEIGTREMLARLMARTSCQRSWKQMDVPPEVLEAGGETDRLDAVLEIGIKSCVAGIASVPQTPVEEVEALRGRLSACKDELMARK